MGTQSGGKHGGGQPPAPSGKGQGGKHGGQQPPMGDAPDSIYGGTGVQDVYDQNNNLTGDAYGGLNLGTGFENLYGGGSQPVTPSNGIATGNYSGPAFQHPAGADQSQAALEAANPQFYTWARQTAQSLSNPVDRMAFTKQMPGINWTDSGLNAGQWNASDEQYYGGGANQNMDPKVQALIQSGRSFWGQ